MTVYRPAHQAKLTAPYRELPLVGSLYTYRKNPLQLYLDIMHKCGDIGLFHLGAQRVFLISSPDLIRHILVERPDDFNKQTPQNKIFEKFVGDTLFTSEGEVHRWQRKLVAPVFQPRRVSSYADTIVRCGEQLQQGWQDGAILDLRREMIRVKMNIAGKVFFGADTFLATDEMLNTLGVAFEYLQYLLDRSFPIPLDWPIPRNIRFKKAQPVLNQYIQAMIAAHDSTEERNDVLSLLLKASKEDGSHMTSQQLYQQTLSFFGAGYEAPTSALIWAWYLLAQHPAIYQKMQQEVDAVCHGRPPRYTDLEHLPYTLQIFKETLRLYPPAYDTSRVALCDMKLGGYSIRKGDLLMIGIYPLHRRPDFFPAPERFIPERFTPENEERLPDCAYLPFGTGPRVCLGNHFSLMEGHLLLATLAQRVTFELAPGQRIVLLPRKASGIRPKYGIKMIVRRRSSNL